MDVNEMIRKEGMRRKLSEDTIKTYSHCLNKFLKINHKPLNTITSNDVQNHLDRLIERNASGNTINVHLNALKFLFEQVLKRKITIRINFAKKAKTLPEFLTKEEIIRLFQALENPKHQLMTKLLYASGMRVRELTKLKVGDFQFDENYGWIRQGKGNKDRPFILPQKLKKDLLSWIAGKKLNADDWLFSGQTGHISVQTIQLIIKKAAKTASITKNVHPHTLRHSFATHLVENGYAITEVQPLLGHSRLETTMLYTHLAAPKLLKVESPFDQLEE